VKTGQEEFQKLKKKKKQSSILKKDFSAKKQFYFNRPFYQWAI